MGKMTTYLIVMSGLMLLFYFTGLINESINSTLLDMLLNPASIQNASLGTKLVLAIEALLVSGIIVLGITTGNLDLVASGPFAIYLFNLGWDFLSVYQVMASANNVLATLIISPLFILWAVTVFEFWRGTDT